MTQNKRTPGAGTPRALEDVASQADTSRDIAAAAFLQASRPAQRYGFTPAVAAVIAGHAFGQPENGRRL